MTSLPPNPGLARRLAYGELIRQSHHNIRNNLTVRGNGIFYTALTSRSNLIDDSSPYEELIELEDIKIGLKISDINKNSNVYVSNNKLVLHINLCIICQDFFNKNCIIREMNCGHPYHLTCIDTWFEDHVFCPICKHHFN